LSPEVLRFAWHVRRLMERGANGMNRNESDQTILGELGARLARHRVDMQLTQSGLAEQAGVSKRTVERVEAGASTQTCNLIRVLRALDLMHSLDRAIPEPGQRPLSLLRQETKLRRRASRRGPGKTQNGKWTWADDQ